MTNPETKPGSPIMNSINIFKERTGRAMSREIEYFNGAVKDTAKGTKTIFNSAAESLSEDVNTLKLHGGLKELLRDEKNNFQDAFRRDVSTINDAIGSSHDDVGRLQQRYGDAKVGFTSFASTLLSAGAATVAFEYGYNKTGMALAIATAISANINLFSLIPRPPKK